MTNEQFETLKKNDDAMKLLLDRVNDVDGVSLEGAAICLHAIEHLHPTIYQGIER